MAKSDLKPSDVPDPRVFNITAFGEREVGRTCLLDRYTHGIYPTTLGPADYTQLHIKDVPINKKNYHLQIHDTYMTDETIEDPEQYPGRRIQAVIIVYDITNKVSFESIRVWMDRINKYSHRPQSLPKMIIGTKCDCEESRAVSKEQGQSVADEYGALFMEVSAKSGQNVEEAFTALLNRIRDLTRL